MTSGDEPAPSRLDRRTALQTAAAALAVVAAPPVRAAEDLVDGGGLVWAPRSTAPAKAVKTSYQPTFVTYLSRFLLNYDLSSANWFRDQLRSLPLTLEREQLRSLREKQFGQFSESVEVGLQRYQGKAGVRALFSFLRSRYGTSAQARLQLALLFSIISSRNQPSALIKRSLGVADNGKVSASYLLDGGVGYARAETPEVTVSEPDGGGAPAVVRAELAPTGQLSSIMLDSGGAGYLPDTSPVVTISAPSGKQARRAQAVAKVENGKVVRLDLTDRGRGYRANDVITVKIDPPLSQYGLVFDGVAAEASAELENGIKRLVVDDGGEGYARDQNLTLTIAPPLQAGGRGAAADLRLKYDVADLEALSSEGPYAEYYPEDSVSTELIQLLPSNVRPTRLPDGNFSFPLAAPSALREAFDRNGGRRQGLDVNMESYLYAARQASGLRQRIPFFIDRDPTFGPLGTSPVEREVSLTTMDYLAFAASGAACTSLVRTALVPLDVAKTLMQSSPEAYPALRPAIGSLWREGGLPSLYRSIDVTAVAGFLLGGFGFGVNEFLRRFIASLYGPEAQALYPLQIAIGAALGSVILTCLVTCPFEVLRIRAIEAASAEMNTGGSDALGGSDAVAPTPAAPTPMMSSAVQNDSEVVSTLAPPPPLPTPPPPLPTPPTPLPASAYNVINGLGTLYDEGGVGTLYSGLTPLLLRELPFSITKFLVYDAATQAIAAVFPLAQEGPLASALLSLTGGLAAGVVAAAISTPADTLLTLSQAAPDADADGGGDSSHGPPTMLQIAKEAIATNPLSLFNGLLPRCVFFGALIAGQFLLYDEFKSLFKVGSSDVGLYLDVFASTDLSFWPKSQ